MAYYNYFFIYLIALNLLGFILMANDKRKAIRNKWRIKERTFFVTSILGGSLGTLIGMYTFRHKTKHKSFTIGIPFILLIESSILIMFIFKYYF